ncbi:hypothetical protein EDD36DRAFT_417294 [Exophiala viscosa]|uniref:Uncharacterized protein n=1 Tax=Exophiala viscosa TaxID=2486360 RepID=A0AAN6E0Z6_9EURO|nr:hypothetical protein EDD36DRAFT_417294 [Exophiala viscosa]
MITTAVASSPSEALKVEADFLQAQAELIRDFGNDVHFAASVIGYRAYDYETRAACLRKASWDLRSVNDIGKCPPEESLDRFRRAKLADSAAEFMNAVQHVKIGLQTVIEIAYRSGLLEDTQAIQEDGEKSSTFPDVPAAIGSLTDLNTGYSLSNTFLNAQESGAAVQPQMLAEISARSVPSADNSTDLQDERIKGRSKSTDLTSYPDMQSAKVTLDEGADAQSPTQPLNEEKVLDWIPSKLRLSRRSIHIAADGVYQSMMMRDQGSEQRKRAY